MPTSDPARPAPGEAAARDPGSGFASGTDPWLERLSSLRNTVRQELVRRRLAELDLPWDATALDVGAGQGTQAIALARRGVRVVALEPDPAMRAACHTALADEPVAVRDRVEVVAGALEDLPASPRVDLGRGAQPREHSDGGEGAPLVARHDLVTCHGVLPYLVDARGAVARLAGRVASNGNLSILARHVTAVPVRPMLRGDWDGVLAAWSELDQASIEQRRPRYRNELGVEACADDVDAVMAWIDATGAWEHVWTGVRLASDALPVDRPVPTDPGDLTSLVAVEERLGRSDPHRRLASLFHLVSHRVGTGG